jgi:NAD(P)-dependent dehydrogenase (short-subunit alcohol dehydrogenase family)
MSQDFSGSSSTDIDSALVTQHDVTQPATTTLFQHKALRLVLLCWGYFDSPQPLNMSVLCAGIMQSAGELTADGYEVHMQTNHLSHFLLTSLLMPALQAAAERRGIARVVHHSSASRKLPATPLKATWLQPADSPGRHGLRLGLSRYQQSKLANMLMTAALQVLISMLSGRIRRYWQCGAMHACLASCT